MGLGVSSAIEINGIEDIAASAGLRQAYGAVEAIQESQLAQQRLGRLPSPGESQLAYMSAPFNIIFGFRSLRYFIAERRAAGLLTRELEARRYLGVENENIDLTNTVN